MDRLSIACRQGESQDLIKFCCLLRGVGRLIAIVTLYTYAPRLPRNPDSTMICARVVEVLLGTRRKSQCLLALFTCIPRWV